MAENYDDIDKKTPDTVDTDGHASDDKDPGKNGKRSEIQ